MSVTITAAPYSKCTHIIFSIALLFVFMYATHGYSYDTRYISMPVDHYSFTKNHTFKLRYLVNDSLWCLNGPIFLYTGNEGNITEFANNAGFLWELAPSFNAMLVFAEHRYYGESQPFGRRSLSGLSNIGYLTSTQALADFVYLISYIQRDMRQRNCNRTTKVIAFGGSYGGMLAAWLRLKYPSVVVGAIASSAPIYQFTGLTDCSKFNDILVDTFKSLGTEACVKNIKKSWSAIRNLTSSAQGMKNVSSILKLCRPIKSDSDVKLLKQWLSDMFANLAMYNYPYPNNELPPEPVKAFCLKMNVRCIDGEPLLRSLSAGMSVYTNHSGRTKCVDISESKCPNERAWSFQSCTEMIMPMCTVENDMFESSPWNITAFSETCYKKHGVRVGRTDLAVLEYGGKQVKYTNVVFTNGLLDPWFGGGFLKTRGSARAMLMSDTAHHLEMRASNPCDPASVTEVRMRIKHNIKCWLGN